LRPLLLKQSSRPVCPPLRRAANFWRGLAICWALAALVGVAVIAVYHFTGWWSFARAPTPRRGGWRAAGMVWRGTRKMTLDIAMASRGQNRAGTSPELHTLLLTAVEQQPAEGGELVICNSA